jgi:hypothetical protein
VKIADAYTNVKAIASRNPHLLTAALVLGVALVYFFSNPKPQGYYDYTFRVASLLLEGHISPAEQPPSWLNEFVPFEGGWYSVFPLGAVVSMLPFAALKEIGIISDMPAAFIYSLLAVACCLFLLLIAGRYNMPPGRQVLLTMAILFGTFTWTNLTFGGAWQLALGFAMLGELGAIWFSAFDRRPLVAGAFFALAFGNRTEILLTAPLFIYLLYRRDAETQRQKREGAESSHRNGFKSQLRVIAAFCAIPFLLGIATLIYNEARFHSVTDFGYARIPGVLNEPWYNHGIFSTEYIPRQAWEMLLKLWETRPTFPYLVPNGFSSSILLSSPFLLFILRTGARDGALKLCAWTAIVAMTFLLWTHGNSGGWQFGYRYAMVLLPWVFIILLENSPKKISPLEWAVYIFSFAANAYATWLFHWTKYLNP